MKNSLDTAREEGFEEGIQQRNFEIAKEMLKKGLDNQTISEITGLSIEDIGSLR